jgi:tetratricopeptide (TPR) repeat protein
VSKAKPDNGARSPREALGVVALVALAVWLGVARNEFVNYDDPDYVTSNPRVQSGLSWENVRWAFATGHASNWHPLTWLSHMADCEWFGLNPSGHHLVSAGLHLLNSFLLLVWLRRITGAIWRSLVVAAFFALHPLHVESVAWVSERKDVLSGVFFMLTLWAYAEYGLRLGTGGEAGGRGLKVWGWYGAAVVLCGLGLMAKPMLVTLPFVLLLLDFWPLRRWGQGGGGWLPRPSRVLLEKAPFFLLSAASSVVTYVVQQRGGAVSTAISLGARIENAVVSYARYLLKTAWPTDLAVLYPHPGHWPGTAVGLSAGVILGITALAVLNLRRRPFLGMGWAWYMGMLVPVIGLVQVGIQSMADRYMYLPMIGLLIAAVWSAAEIFPQVPNRSRILGGAVAALLLACALLTARQIGFWRNSEELFRRTVAVTRNNYLAHNNLGFYLSGRGQVAEAIAEYRRSLAIKPDYAEALNNLGHALAGQRQYREAIECYRQALASQPNHPEVHNNLANALAEIGQVDEAIKHYQFVLERNPEHADAHNNYGIALAMKGRLDEAIGHFQAAIRFKKDYAGAHSNLGNALAAKRQLPAAIEQYEICLWLNPNDAQAHNNLGNVRAELGQLEEAVRHYQRALELKADNPEAHLNLSIVLFRQGNRVLALEHCRRALELKPDYEAARQHFQALNAAAR